MPSIILLTLRPVETWTTVTTLASLVLLAVVVVGLGWWIATATERHDRTDDPFG